MNFIILENRRLEDEMEKRVWTPLWVRIVLLLSLFFFHACSMGVLPKQTQNNSANSPYLVKEVIDGDTIRLQDGQLIRYLGINTPEKEIGRASCRERV